MANDPRLERYLVALERALKAYPVSDRAEVITEIKSHVLSALEHDPEARLDHVLAALGEPETVANRYLMDRGLKTTKPPISPVVKWIMIGFLTTFAMILIFVGFLLTQFSPLVRVDDKADKVTLLGGLIQVNGDDVKINGFGNHQGHDIVGSTDTVGLQGVSVAFASGSVELTNSNDARVSWTCRGAKGEAIQPTNDKGQVTIDFSKVGGLKCEITVPEKIAFAISGHTGKIEIAEPKYNVDANLDVGKIDIQPADKMAYHYDLNVGVGKISNQDSLKSSDSPEALKIKIHVGTGKIGTSD